MGIEFGRGWKTSHNRFQEPWSEPAIDQLYATAKGVTKCLPFLIQGAGEEMGECFGCNLSFFLHTIHVDSESKVFPSV
jgi:hypothetical protein